MRKETAELWNLVEPYARGAGFELVELQWGREEGGWVLRLFIDRPWSEDGREDPAPRLPGATEPDQLFEAPTVGHEDCERVSRDVSAALDVADHIAHAYRLEVSSPGIERPLRREKDFRRFTGRKVKIRTNDVVDGRRNFSGILAGAADGVVQVHCDGRSYQVPIDAITRANLVPDWDAEFRRANSQAQPQAHQEARDRGRDDDGQGAGGHGDGAVRDGRGRAGNSGSSRSAP